jgi:hypothetical protein
MLGTNEFTIVEYLAEKAKPEWVYETVKAKTTKSRAERPTRYAIRKKKGLAKSSILVAVRALEDRNLVRAVAQRRWGRRAFRQELALTFVGCVFYLAELAKKPTRHNQNVVTSLAERYGKSLEYAPFMAFQKIDEALDRQGSEIFCAVAQDLVNYPPYADWNLVTFKQSQARKYLKLWERRARKLNTSEERLKHPQARRRLKRWQRQAGELKASQERLWMKEFAMHLLSDLQETYPPIFSSELNSFYKHLLQERITRKREDLENETKQLRRLDSVIRPMDKTESYRPVEVQTDKRSA